MSEYQYYEFRSIDRPLTRDEMDELGALSTRAEITPTSFTNTYNYGDFRGKPAKLMDRYFDAFVYVANWGTHRFMLRIPLRFLNVEAATAYAVDEAVEIDDKEEHVVIEFVSQEEGGDWVNGEPWMASLIGVRAELMRGDLRALYIGWLSSLRNRFGYDANDLGEEGKELEPPVPQGLAKLSAPLKELAEFLRVDDDLIETAAEGSDGNPPSEPSPEALSRWIKKLPTADKDGYLFRFLREEGDLLLRSELFQRFMGASRSEVVQAVGLNRRTIAQLLAACDARSEEKTRLEAERDTAEQDRLRKKHVEERARYLDELAAREARTWIEVDTLIATKRPQDYDRAVALLVDLCELAERSGRRAAAEARIRDLRERHRSKSSFLKRLDQRRLGK
jgi:hypothetical protein